MKSAFDELLNSIQQTQALTEKAYRAVSSALERELAIPVSPAFGDQDAMILMNRCMAGNASFSVGRNQLNGDWWACVGSKSTIHSGGPNFAFCLAVAMLLYHGKVIPLEAHGRFREEP